MSPMPGIVATDLAAFSAKALQRVRDTSPLVQCLTNSVVTNFTANVLLAAGAAPAMVDIVGEAGPFAEIASGVLLNLGTLPSGQPDAMREAAAAAARVGTPWVLDPVAVGSLPVRTVLAEQLVALRPTVVRGNPSEIIAVAGLGGGGRGVDATAGVEDAAAAASALAERTGGMVAVSGPVDLVVGGGRSIRVANGDPLLTRVTGGGCALGALMAAYVADADDRLAGTAAAVAHYTVAAELAAEQSQGPGSFAVAFLDALAAVTPEIVAERARFDVG
jgi:hydroxyethylthiazole kinase